MSDGHLFLSARGGVDYAGDSRHAWYDATHQSVLLLSPRSRKLRQIPLDASLDPAESTVQASPSQEEKPRRLVFDFTEPAQQRDACERNGRKRGGEPPILLLQLSVDAQFLAIQRSDIEVQVLHRASRATYWVLCKPKAGNRILHGGVLWNTHSSKPRSSQDLFLVTKLGLEHYRASAKRRNCALHRTIGLYVHAFWYAASHGVLLLSSGSRANEVAPFLLHGANVEKLPRLVFSTSVSQSDLHLVSLYGELYVVYSDTRSTKLLLYLVGRSKVSCVRSLNLMLPPGTALAFSVVDNLLVCHSLDFNVSLFFDVRCEGNINEPFSAPLPVSVRPPGHSLPSEADPEATTLEPATPAYSYSSSPPIVSGFEDLDFQEVEVGDVERELEEEPGRDAKWASPKRTPSIRRALSVDNLQVHKYEDLVLPSPSHKHSPASRLASRRVTRRLQRTMTAASLEEADRQQQHETATPMFSRWRFHAPNLVQRSFTVKGRSDLIEQVEVRKLQVNLREICKSCARHPEILPFLLRRGDHELAKRLVLNLVREHVVEQQASLPAVAQLIGIVQTTCQDARNDEPEEVLSSSSSKFSDPAILPGSSIRNADGLVRIVQTDFYRHVWSEVLKHPVLVKTGRLSLYISEYIKNLRKNKVPVENVTFLALAQSFLAAGEPHKLYQFMHYHVLADSTELADLMVHHGCTFPDLMQVGLDMYFRLGAVSQLVCTLLDLGQIERAIEIAWENMRTSACDASVIPGVTFFESLVKAVTSSGQFRSSLQVTQMLGNLLLFLKVWDPVALLRSNTTSLSTLASTTSMAFPDELIAPTSRARLRAAFGFAPE